MHDRFVGNPNIPQVRQPEGSELCFAAISSAVSGEDIQSVHMALQAAYLSEEDGSTAPPFDFNKEVILENGKVMKLQMVKGYETGEEDTGGVIREIDEKLQAGMPVALLYKKSDEQGGNMHWVLLTGYTPGQRADSVNAVEIMDPLNTTKVWAEPLEVLAMIDRSIQADGVFAYSLELTASGAS
jgi:hypothetical protein